MGLRDEQMRMSRGGFTLLELMLVVVILALLVLMALPGYSRATQSARDTQTVVDLHAIYLAILQFQAQYSRLPKTWGELPKC